ncbi:MAG TPA: glycosyltransferase family 4 protein [Vicinamibacterales bacterium]|nr:glycosyltransferase family 4 protein [Vicinamibacterales bacterium]
MRVLHLCAGNLYGGVERIVAECAASRDLVPAMQPAFVVCFDGRLAREVEATGARCHRLGAVRVSRPHSVFLARRRLGEVLLAVSPDVAICHSSWTFGFAAPVLARQRVPAAIWLHDRVSGGTWPERWAALSAPRLAISNSRFTAASIASLFPTTPVSVVYAPVTRGAAPQPGTRSRLRAAFGAGDDCVVLIASRFEHWKGHRELIAALAGIPARWQLWIAGAPQKAGERELEAALREQCRTAGILGRVRFLGHRDDVRDLMHAADVYCQPNTGAEPFGLAFVEALYARLPVITTAMGGALEIVTPECGVLVPPGDATALRESLTALMADGERRSALGAAGPVRAEALCDPARQLEALARTLAPLSASVTRP